MCGIAGIFEFDLAARPDGRVLDRMAGLVAHRGPDDSGAMMLRNVGLAHRRLSIIDLSDAGRQPMPNDDGSVWITYNGECYNYAALAAKLRAQGVRFRSHSDTEVILRLYEARGAAFLREIDGMFALAIWDSRRNLLLLARDRLGIKPLFYFADERHLAFASEMKALLGNPAAPNTIDLAALGDFLHLLSIPDPLCIFAGIKKLLPGHYLEVTPAGVVDRSYWEIAIAPDAAMTFDAASHEFERRFERAVASHLVADVPVGAFLSGGVDSSSIVAVAAPLVRDPVETFSITFPGLEEFDESRYAAMVATHCGARHHEFNLAPALVEALPKIAWHADEPFAVSSSFALYFIAGLARRHVKVVLSGDGGDEVFAGYVWRHVDFAEPPPLLQSICGRVARLVRSQPLQRLIPSAWRRHFETMGSESRRYINTFCNFSGGELDDLLDGSVANDVARAWDGNIVERCFNGARSPEQLARKLYTDVKTTLVSEMLTKVDRMTMAHGLEARVPFLDHQLVEWAFTVPGRHKLEGSEGKRLVKKAMEPHLPREILYRRKQGFNVPLKLWMRGELREFVRDSLSEGAIARRGIFRPREVTALFDSHFSGKVDASNKIFSLLMLELWHQAFVDGRRQYAA
ncbi:MAG TPA: asparagine synthase (glutamine-hydrolyzing) [Stellaceae bacterium]|nr:asparagine synthase (glutamine-hydrolyzing) [Stellaceae bacterium]